MSSKFSWEEVQKHNGADGSYWAVVNQEIYDISDFVDIHPGGDVIRLAAGRDSTCLIHSYHPTDKIRHVEAVLQQKCPKIGFVEGPFPGNTMLDSQVGDESFFLELRKRVMKHLRDTNTPWNGSESWAIFEVLATLSCYYALTLYRATHASYFVSILLGLVIGRMGFLMHCGNHRAQSKRHWINIIAGYCMSIVGSNHVIWQFEHQVAHHLDPNTLSKDNDCEIGDPWLRFHPQINRRWWHRCQHISTIIAMSFGFHKWYVSDFVHYMKGQVGSIKFHVSASDWLLFIIFKIQWGFLNIVVPWYYLGFIPMIIQANVSMFVGAHYLEEIFIVNHIQKGLVPPERTHWARKQVFGSANWSSGSRFWNWFSGGLNHQVEHHLFPSMSIHVYPKIAHIVKQTCKDFNLPYNNFSSFFRAHKAMLTYLYELGKYDDPIKHSKAKFD